jgi:predicted alpha/beta-hydrolase family hydrolase
METTSKLESLEIPVTPEISVPAVLGIPEWWPTGDRVGLVLAHDTRGNMEEDLIVHLHTALSGLGALTVRFNFPYAQQGKKRPDSPALLQRTLRSVTTLLLSDPQNSPARLILAGVGLGARVAAEAVAQGTKADGLVLYSYPLHPVGKPGHLRADVLFRIICPMLFVQGTKDPTCRLERLRDVLRRIGAPTALRVVEDADHAFGVAKRSPRTVEEVRAEVVAVTNSFLGRTTRGS